MNGEENRSLKSQVEELRAQLNNKDLELKNYLRNITELEQQINEAHHVSIF